MDAGGTTAGVAEGTDAGAASGGGVAPQAGETAMVAMAAQAQISATLAGIRLIARWDG